MHSVPENVNQLFFLLALAVWIGGIFAVAIAAPIIFQVLSSRAQAGQIVELVLRKLNQLKLIGAGMLLVTSVIDYAAWRDDITGALAARYALLAATLVLAAAAALVITPRLQRLNRELERIERNEVTANRRRFDRIHRLNSMVTSIELACAVAVLYTV